MTPHMSPHVQSQCPHDVRLYVDLGEDHSLILWNTHKIYSTKAAMSDLSQICKELFWVLLEKEISNFGVLQAPRPTAVGHNGEWGAMPLPPGTIWVCDSDVEAPTDGSSAGQRSHMCSELKAQGKTRMSKMEKHSSSIMYSCPPSINDRASWLTLNGQQRSTKSRVVYEVHLDVSVPYC